MTVSKQIIEVLDAICDKFGIAVDWTADNVLPYLQELAGKFIAYEIATSVAWIMIPIVLCIICFVLARRGYKTDNDDLLIPFLMIGCAIAVVGIIIICCQVFDIVTCCTLPEKILLREIKYLLATIK